MTGVGTAETHGFDAGKHIVVDQERADQVLGTVMAAYGEGSYPYDLGSAHLLPAHRSELFDLHILRVTIANELITFEGYEEDENVLSPELVRTCEDLFYNYAAEHDIDILTLCDAVWLLSKSLCETQPGNMTLEPFEQDEQDEQADPAGNLIAIPVDIGSSNQQAAYERTCRQCPLEDSCEWNVPSTIYYAQNEVRRRGKRIRFPITVQTDLL